jgi:hypothetical protein
MVFYKKNKNSELLHEIESSLQLSNVQNYIPIYNQFFSLNETNWNSINLKNDCELLKIWDCTYNKATATLQNNSTTPVFFKYSPLLDPLKYLNGKYTDYTYCLPSLKDSYPKLQDTNNSAYVDSFFSYLSSQLYANNKFVHAIQFHGSYLGIKKNFKYNLEDELDQVQGTSFFNENMNKLFTLNKELTIPTSHKNREKIVMDEETIVLDLDDIIEDTKPESTVVFPLPELEVLVDLPVTDTDEIIRDDDSTSSKSSNTETDYTEELESDDYSDCDEDESYGLTVDIHQFPVQLIALERCKDTLDSLLMETVPPEEIVSALFQVIMTLIMYQNVYQFTHNDLHTNNIMYVETTEPYLYYKYKGINYKVPTYGRIFKIIDFGRAIYTYNNKFFISDSFHPDGDAATQYNIEPFRDSSKPVVGPNFSFDLCRLACSMLDIIADDTPLYNLVEEWCLDDKGRNVLYKKNGEERYPDFKLYKMIVRTVHNHLPEMQLSKPIFKDYITNEVHKDSMIILI